MTEVPEVPEEYNAEARTADRARDIYARRGTSRPSYTRPDPPGTVREENPEGHHGYTKATFPIMRANQVARFGVEELPSEQGTLWRLQRAIADAKFDLLKQTIAAGEHMVSDIQAEVVIRLSVRTLTDKARTITKVNSEQVKEVSILMPNGDFHYGGY